LKYDALVALKVLGFVLKVLCDLNNDKQLLVAVGFSRYFIIGQMCGYTIFVLFRCAVI